MLLVNCINMFVYSQLQQSTSNMCLIIMLSELIRTVNIKLLHTVFVLHIEKTPDLIFITQLHQHIPQPPFVQPSESQ